MTTSYIEAALLYGTGMKWPVFPASPVSKRPLIKTGRDHAEHASRDPEQIDAWFKTEFPGAAIAMPTGAASGVVVIDADAKHDGEALLAELEAKLGALPRTHVVRTQSGGIHVYLAHPGVGIRIKSTAGFLGCLVRPGAKEVPGVDVRGDGGIVLLPPSAGYTWELTGKTFDPLPAAWLAALTGPQKQERAPVGHEGGIAEGTRNNTLTSLAGSMRRAGMSEEGILAALLAENETRCDPPLEETEVAVIAGSVSGYPAGTGATDFAIVAGGIKLAEQSANENAPTDAPELYGVSMGDFIGDDDPGDDGDSWLVHGIIAAGVPQLICGPPKAHKTFILEHLAICVAAGVDWLGRFRVTQGKVLGFPLEDSVIETRKRIWRLARGLGLDPRRDLDSFVIENRHPFKFGSRADIERMYRTIEKHQPSMVWIDSLSRTHFGDENSVKEMQVVTAQWSAICQRFEVAMPLIHHFNKTGTGSLLQRVRGSSDLGALARHLVGVEKPEEGLAELSFEGNLHPLEPPFRVSIKDELTAEGRKCIRLAHQGTAASAAVGRIEHDILAELAEAAPGGLTLATLRRTVTGANDTIGLLVKRLLASGRVSKVSGRYYSAGATRRAERPVDAGAAIAGLSGLDSRES